MKPAAYTPPALWPATTAPEDVPSQVVEVWEFNGITQPPRTVIIYHVAGPLHENARLCAARYARRGYRVEYTLNPKDLIVPLSRVREVRRAA